MFISPQSDKLSRNSGATLPGSGDPPKMTPKTKRRILSENVRGVQLCLILGHIISMVTIKGYSCVVRFPPVPGLYNDVSVFGVSKYQQLSLNHSYVVKWCISQYVII